MLHTDRRDLPVVRRDSQAATIAASERSMHFLHEQYEVIGILLSSSSLWLCRVLPVNICALEAISIHKTDEGANEGSTISLGRYHVGVGIIGFRVWVVKGPLLCVSIDSEKSCRRQASLYVTENQGKFPRGKECRLTPPIAIQVCNPLRFKDVNSPYRGMSPSFIGIISNVVG